MSKSASSFRSSCWFLAILSGKIDLSLAATGGVHTSIDAIKAIMAGAHAVQLVSALLQTGVGHLATIRQNVEEWLGKKGYESLSQMRGSMNLANSPDAAAYERANYISVLLSAS